MVAEVEFGTEFVCNASTVGHEASTHAATVVQRAHHRSRTPQHTRTHLRDTLLTSNRTPSAFALRTRPWWEMTEKADESTTNAMSVEQRAHHRSRTPQHTPTHLVDTICILTSHHTIVAPHLRFSHAAALAFDLGQRIWWSHGSYVSDASKRAPSPLLASSLLPLPHHCVSACFVQRLFVCECAMLIRFQRQVWICV